MGSPTYSGSVPCLLGFGERTAGISCSLRAACALPSYSAVPPSSAFLGGRICWPAGRQPPDSPPKRVVEALGSCPSEFSLPGRIGPRSAEWESRALLASDGDWSRRRGDWLGRRSKGESFSLARSGEGGRRGGDRHR